MRGKISLLALALTLFAAPAWAGVESVGGSGFALTETVDINATPERLYDALIVPSRWWNSEHTFSRDAANLTLDARAGGCWCESLQGGGSVEHMIVVNVMPGKLLRMRGALGPLQGMAVDGALTFTLAPAGGATRVTMDYAVGGYLPASFDDLAKAVDSVLTEQLQRLKHYAESGSPEVAPPQTKGPTP